MSACGILGFITLTIMSFHTCKLLMIIVWWFFIATNFTLLPVSCILTGTEQGILCQESERQALLTFKAGLTDEGGLLSSWSDDDNSNCCSWKGVSCSNQTRHVVKLDLRFGLEGEVSSSLLELKYLEYLDLSLNNFNFSKIPAFLSSLENLRYLNLSYSSFSGIVPPHLGNLSRLQYLDLGGSPYDIGSLEVVSLQWLNGLSSLKHLNLDKVNLNKAGPDWLKAINMLPSLLELHLSGCVLSSLPLFINQPINFTSLSTLDLSHNNFNSSLTMPPWLFNLTDLVNLGCSGCSLQTVIPNEIGKLVKLQQLDFSVNDIGGQLPASLGNLSNLGMLNLEYSGIEGRIPATLGNLCRLRELNLGANNLKGEINEFINGLERSCSNEGNNLEALDLSDNSLVGNLPTSIGCLVKLVSLDLSRNSFWGSIPTTIGSLARLKKLYIPSNKMNGTIAGSIGQLSELEKLYLYGNTWHGLLTETHFQKHAKLQDLRVTTTSKVGNLVVNVTQDWLPPFKTSLSNLELSGARLLSRELPRWIQTLHQLEGLSLNDCGISDSIPTEFWKSCPNITSVDLSNNAVNIQMSFKNLERLLPLVPASKLQRLELANNGFSNGGGGEIPSNIDQLLPSLGYLDLSSNSLSGEIPQSICHLTNFEYIILRNNSLSGELTHHHWEKMMYSLLMLDVSLNRLVGKIPESLGSLTSLSLLLLSDNNLQGEIPTFINCTTLRVLDLGGNKLTGNIPPSLAVYNTELVLLKLRGNMLSGTISPEMCLLSALRTLDLAHNNLQGIIPKCLGNLSTSNGPTGDYPTDVTALVSKGREYTYGSTIVELVHLVDLSGNNLSGNIPGSLMNLTAMQTLNLSMNHLTGVIPSNIGELRMLESLDLSQNRLSGPIPQSLSALSFLSALNLSQNNFSGKIPLAGGQLQTLNDSSRYEGNPLLCGPPLLRICPGTGNEPTKENGGENEKDGKRRFDLDKWGFILSVVLGFFVGFWGVCGPLVLKASWRQAYFGYLAGIKDKIIVTVVVKVARLQRKMGDIRTTT